MTLWRIALCDYGVVMVSVAVIGATGVCSVSVTTSEAEGVGVDLSTMTTSTVSGSTPSARTPSGSAISGTIVCVPGNKPES